MHGFKFPVVNIYPCIVPVLQLSSVKVVGSSIIVLDK